MKIPSVSVISSKSNYNKVNFAGREDNDRVTNPTSSKGPLVAIPLATLIALMTANYSPANAKNLTNEPTQTEYVAPNENVYIQSAQQRKTDVDPHDIVSLSRYKIQEITRYKSDGNNYNMIYTTSKDDNSKQVKGVYFAPCDYDGYVQRGNKKVRQVPPRAINLIYHDLGDDTKSFCGVSVVTYVPSKDGTYLNERYEEIRVPDEVGQKIMDLIGNDTKWENKTSIGFIETNNPTLFPAKEL